MAGVLGSPRQRQNFNLRSIKRDPGNLAPPARPTLKRNLRSGLERCQKCANNAERRVRFSSPGAWPLAHSRVLTHDFVFPGAQPVP